MKLKISFVIMLLALFSFTSLHAKRANPLQNTAPHEKALTMLKTDKVEMGILAQAGGTIVLLRTPGGPNLLLSTHHIPVRITNSTWVHLHYTHKLITTITIPLQIYS
ncbi:MAG: hypothetical protein WCO98_02750 [bacterium]